MDFYGVLWTFVEFGSIYSDGRKSNIMIDLSISKSLISVRKLKKRNLLNSSYRRGLKVLFIRARFALLQSTGRGEIRSRRIILLKINLIVETQNMMPSGRLFRHSL